MQQSITLSKTSYLAWSSVCEKLPEMTYIYGNFYKASTVNIAF